jgi:hypothetical protein
MNSEKFISLLIAPGVWRRLYKTMMMIPAAIQKIMLRYDFGGFLRTSGMVYSFREIILTCFVKIVNTMAINIYAQNAASYSRFVVLTPN